MARYFKFRSLADLEAESQHLGLDLRFSADFDPLFRPVTIGPLRAGNSLCIQPMEGCDGTLDGRPDELTLRRYQRFGAGGAKLIWGEATAVLEEARANSRQLLMSEQTAPALERLLRECRQSHRAVFGSDDDLVVGLQLTHSGRYSHRRPLLAFHDPILDPRTSADMLSELLAAKTRPGPYGGSLENRTRLARDIIVAIRAEVPALVIATRLNVYDGIPYRKGAGDNGGEPCPWKAPVQSAWGTREDDPFTADLTEPVWWIGEMRRLGVSLVNVSMGNPYATPHVIRPFEYPPPDGYETPEHPLIGVDRHFRLTAELQEKFPDLPLVGSGYSYLQEFLCHAGAANLRDRRTTFVGVGRAALPQPDFARQLLTEGRLDRKRICRTFSYCTALMRAKHNDLGQFATGCPPFDKQVYGPIWEQAKEQ